MVETVLADDGPFARPPSPRGERAAGLRAPEGVTRIGESVVIEGEVKGSENIVIDGKVDGMIDLQQHVLTISPTGRVEGSRWAGGGEVGRRSRAGKRQRHGREGEHCRERLGRRRHRGPAGGYSRRGAFAGPGRYVGRPRGGRCRERCPDCGADQSSSAPTSRTRPGRSFNGLQVRRADR